MRKRLVGFGTTALFLFVTLAFARSDEPAALVVQVSGTVHVQRTGQSARIPARVGLDLMVGDRVIIADGGKAVLLFRTGRMQVTGETLTIPDSPRGEPAGLFRQTATTLAQIATTNARTQPNRQGMIRVVEGEPTAISPRNGIKLTDLRPTFTWSRVPGANAYTIQIRRLQPLPGKPERYGAGTDTVWSYPGDAPALIPGGLYEWTVASSTAGRAAGVQRFRIMGGDDFGRVAATLNQLAGAGIDPMGDGLFLTALAYRDAGLMYDARRVLDRLAAAGAGGRAYALLRGEVLDALGELDAAARAFASADAEPRM